MESAEATSALPGQRDSSTLDTDLYDTGIYAVPDPGLLQEGNEPSFSETQQALRYFTTHPLWRTLTPRARARQLWLLLRTGLHDIVEKEKRAELHVARLTHGLEPLRRLELASGLRTVAQDPAGGRFVVLDGAGCLHLHREDGSALEELRAPIALTGLVTLPGPLGDVGRFVGWGPAGLAILGTDFRLLWLSEPRAGRGSAREPTCCLPVPRPGLLLVAEAGGSLALWKFRSGSRRLVPHGLPLQLPPGPAGALSRLALGPPGSPHHHHAPRCFAACGAAVLTLDLHSWALVDVRWDLHRTTISDLAYCAAVEATVTASRDSMVKVWEANWQIRMVFVGHTGPVTAMAVLPNTALVLSASQDGTLRTWDLQAAAQVGEVALRSWDPDVPLGRVSRLLAPARAGWPVFSLSAGTVELWRVRELYSLLAQLPAPVLHLHVAPPLPAPAHPPLPMRLVCACADGSVCLVSASTGRTVSALLLEPEDRAAAVAYCLPREVLWLLTCAGHLVRVNAARCPMRVLRRVCPPPSPAPRPSCLHLYSHIPDPASARDNWEVVCQHGGELGRSDVAGAWKDKNRYLPVVGRADGALLVLEWHTLQPVFHAEAHGPGPVTAIASTWNCIVSSGADLTVKMWRVFPYAAEESLSLLRTFSCCHPAVALSALGTRVTVGFEAPASATYGLVQFGLGNSQRFDHRPQDDPTDHITGLCCCPSLNLYASSSLDGTVRLWTSENRLLRLLQLNGAPQALTFCSNSGDLVLALGPRLCLVSHALYLPTSYLAKKLCQKLPEVVDDPPLPLTSQELLPSAQLQRLASLSATLTLGHHQKATPPQPVLEEEAIEALAARDRDLQQLRLGLVVPAAPPPLSWTQHEAAFDNYLNLIYGPDLLGTCPRRGSQEWSFRAHPAERDASEELRQSGVSAQPQAGPTALSQRDLEALCQRLARPPRAPLPIPPASRKVHSKASQLLAHSSLSYILGLSLDLQLQLEQLQEETQVARDLPSSHQQPKTPPKKRSGRPLAHVTGFFPATVQLFDQRLLWPIRFPGFVPNSAVLQRLWPWPQMGGPGARTLLAPQKWTKSGANLDNQWPSPSSRQHGAMWQRRLVQWLEDRIREEQPAEEEEEEEELQRSLSSLSSWGPPSEELALSKEQRALVLGDAAAASARSRLPSGGWLWEERYGHLPSFLHFFICQNWFKKLFPLFSLEAYPEVGTVEGLASLFADALEAASWADGVSILGALLRLVPDVSRDLRGRLRPVLLRLLNQDRPPSLQDSTQKQFVLLALQLLLACTLESWDVVLELLTYFLYSPADCQPELRKLLSGLGLQDPQGVLFEEMVTWAQGWEINSKASLRSRCGQKLQDMVRALQMETVPPPVLAVLPRVSETSEPSWSVPRETQSQASQDSATLSSASWPLSHFSEKLSGVLAPPEPPASARAQDSAAPEPQAAPAPPRARIPRTRRTLSESLQPFCTSPEAPLRTSAPAALRPLEQTAWARSQVLDLEPVDALNLFCERQLVRRGGLLQEKEKEALRLQSPGTVVRQPLDSRYYPIVRLQEAKIPPLMSLRGRTLRRGSAGRFLDGSIRTLKLPLPRVEPQPFPPDWPTPARPLPPLLLQPALQRYFLPEHTRPAPADPADPAGRAPCFSPAWGHHPAGTGAWRRRELE